MNKYPESEKLSQLQPKSNAINEFLDWCEEQGYELRDWNLRFRDQPGPLRKQRQDIIAAHLGIDMDRAEEEMRMMIAENRAKRAAG